MDVEEGQPLLRSWSYVTKLVFSVDTCQTSRKDTRERHVVDVARHSHAADRHGGRHEQVDLVVIQQIGAAQDHPAVIVPCFVIRRCRRPRFAPFTLPGADGVVLDAERRAGVDKDFGPAGAFDDAAGLRVQHAGLQRGAKEGVEYRPQQTPDRDAEDPEHLVGRRPAADLVGEEDAADGAGGHGAERQERRGGQGDGEGAGGAGEEADGGDAAVCAWRDGAEGVRDEVRGRAGEDAEFRREGVGGGDSVVGDDAGGEEEGGPAVGEAGWGCVCCCGGGGLGAGEE